MHRIVFHQERETGMWTLHVRLSAIAAATLLLSLTNQLAFARGSQAGHDDPWNSDHIDRLPPEVRSAVTRMCGNCQVLVVSVAASLCRACTKVFDRFAAIRCGPSRCPAMGPTSAAEKF